MANPSPDNAALLGGLEKVSATLDAGLVEFARMAGEGELSLGLRRLLRECVEYRFQTGELPVETLHRLDALRPGRLGDYHTAHPARFLDPFRFPPAKVTNNAARKAKATKTKAIRAALRKYGML